MSTHYNPPPGNLPATSMSSPSKVQQANIIVRLLYLASNTVFQWPQWARTARIAGAYFYPAEDSAVVAQRLNRFAAEHVSVIIADSPLGSQYSAWVDDDRFEATRAMMACVVEMAHARNLKIVMYHTGCELSSESSRNPSKEHPEWTQRGLDGSMVLFNDVSNDDEHWLHTGIWDFWVHPCDTGEEGRSFRSLAFRRICDMVRTGIDGLWVDQAYLQSSVGPHHDMWPSSDACSAAAFKAATNLDMPCRQDWDDPVFRRWVVWRHAQIADYLLAEMQVARAVNPQIVFFNENSSVDSGRSTYVATDAASFFGLPDISTAHEVETISDRMDHGETGMQAATLEQWLAFRTMIAFARATDRGKPSWILTYGYKARDSAQLAGFVVAEGANFYENKGPQMADSVGSAFRAKLFGWIAAHEDDLYGVDSAAEVGLLYSPRNRDLIDAVSGEPYDVADSTHFAAYRGAACELHKAHIPVDVVLDTDTERFAHYRVLIATKLDLMSDATAAALCSFQGKLITIGANGNHDEWLVPRAKAALKGHAQVHFKTPSNALAQAADTRLLGTTAPATLQIGLRKALDGYRLVIVNTASVPAPAFAVTLRVDAPLSMALARMSVLGKRSVDLPVSIHKQSINLSVAVPAGIDSIALVTIRREPLPGV